MNKIIKVGSDFSGVGAFDTAIKRIFGNDTETVFACDMDKFARQSYIANYGEPKYYPENVYDREIPKESLDIYMTSPPCQSFSLAGKRKGKDSENGILFFNSHEFIQKNNPRHFIFENVKGLLSDDNGNTFKEWCNMLGGKSINGNPVLFPFDNSAPYHIYFKVLNSKKHGVPQNRERVFIIGIRDDSDNNFTWPKEEYLTKKLKDVLENDVPDKYFLSDNAVNRLCNNESGFGSVPKNGEDVASCVCASDYKIARGMNVLKVKSATKQGYETATENDSINFTHPDSKTRRGRVGKEVAQTLDTSCNQGVMIGAIRGRNPDNPNSRTSGLPTKQMLEINESGTSNCLTTVQKDNVVVEGFKIRKLTPRECFRLQDFPDTFKFVCSDSQLYKQAGNSITVRVLELIISKLNLK